MHKIFLLPIAVCLFFIFLICVRGCKNESTSVIEAVVVDERYYMEQIKSIARSCNFEIKCMNEKISKNIPSNYYVHVRRIKVGWEFACIDTTNGKNRDRLQKSQKAARGF